MAEPIGAFTITLDQVQDYEFRVKFDKESMAELLTDEPPPLGQDAGPSPSRLLGAAIGNCLASSLLFCARKARVNLGPVHAEVKLELLRNENRRLRIGRVVVTIDPNLAEADRANAARCLGLFEDFCTVTQSVRDGLDIQVTVKGMEAEQSRAL